MDIEIDSGEHVISNEGQLIQAVLPKYAEVLKTERAKLIKELIYSTSSEADSK